MKSKKLLESFTVYCKNHPEERFWQALRNWCGWGFIFVCTTMPHELYGVEGKGEDTFYWEKNETP